MKIKLFILVTMLALTSSCTTYPQDEENQATFYVEHARKEISSENNIAGSIDIESALVRRTGDKKVKELFESYPKAQDAYQWYLEQYISNINNAFLAELALKKIKLASSAKIFTGNQSQELILKLNNTISSGNKSGAIPFDLSSNTKLFPDLNLPEHRRIIVDRTIKELQENPTSKTRPIAALMSYVNDVGKHSTEGRRIESFLPSMKIHRDELEIVAKQFPLFIEARSNEITVSAILQVKNIDRLQFDDIINILKLKTRGIDWITSPIVKATTVTIERVRHDERFISENSKTIMYARHEVDLLNAALLMPKNASYLYELVSSGTEIDYGYIVKAEINGKLIHDELVRGKVGGEYRRCQNARIQNVFGGTTPAGFIANADMQQKCNDHPILSIEMLREEVLSKIVDSVLKIPPLKAIHEVN